MDPSITNYLDLCPPVERKMQQIRKEEAHQPEA
jgi:hypothetical protein